MAKRKSADLDADAVEFVRKVITEIYGQRATTKTIKEAAKGLVAALPQAEEAPSR